MMHRRFAARLLNRPQLIAPAAGAAVLEALLPGARLLGFGEPAASSQRTDRDYEVVGTTAIIPVVGELIHRGGWMDAMSGVCSYQGLADMTADALRDPGVTGIIFDHDSPGGEAAGCLDFAEWLAGQRGVKPMAAIINQLCCSASYACASAVDPGRIYIGASAFAGSIGVVSYHADLSKALQSEGIDVTFIYAGARKIDGTQALPLSPEARVLAQASVDAEYDRFCRIVAANRGMTPEAVAATEAGIFRGQDAVSAGLADAIATPEEALAAMSTTTVTAPAGARMQTPKPAAAAETQPTLDAAAAQQPPPSPPAPGSTEAASAQVVADECTRAGHPGLIAGLLKQSASLAAVQARLGDAKGIVDAAKAVGLAAVGNQLVMGGVSLEAARAILFETKAATDGAVRTDPAHAQGAGKPAAKLDHKAIYARMNAPPAR